MKRQTHYDYVIAGAGSAGCVLAARLTEDPTINVCLIEAGGKGQDLFIKMPAGNGFIFGNPKLDWGYESTPQPHLNNRQIYLPRGKAMGGSSIMNGMIYMRGVPEDYDNWQSNGLEGWGFSDLFPYFKRAQGATDRDSIWHGKQGPLKTELSNNYGTLEQAFVEAAVAAGHQHLDDFNGLQRTGVARTDSTVFHGIRQSTAIAYLKKPSANLTVLNNKHIAKVLLQKNSAIGVVTSDGDEIMAGSEVILCQGAFGTPQTLLLSGIGPAQHLQSKNINPVVDLAAVGQNLLDHLDVSIQYASDRMDLSLAQYQRLDKAAALMARWLWNGTGPGSGAFFSAVLFHAINNQRQPELEVFMTPMIIDENLTLGESEKTPLLQRFGRKLLVRGRKAARPGIQIDINLERPESRGCITLSSDNPLDPPCIDPNFLSSNDDINALCDGVKAMQKVMKQPQISQYTSGPIGAWKNAHSKNEIIAAIRSTAYSGHHPCSTVRMGGRNDNNAVLDDRLCVRGVENLRVCDASAMPGQITGNINATIIAMAEKAADMILHRPALAPEDPRTAENKDNQQQLN